MSEGHKEGAHSEEVCYKSLRSKATAIQTDTQELKEKLNALEEDLSQLSDGYENSTFSQAVRRIDLSTDDAEKAITDLERRFKDL